MSGYNLFTFSDQSSGHLQVLQRLLRATSSRPLLRKFINSASDQIRNHRSVLGSQSSCQLDSAESLSSLLYILEDEKYLDSISSTYLSCITQLGSLILFSEDDPSLLFENDDSQICYVGLCTGAIAAAAAASTTSVEDLCDLSTELLPVLLRLGYAANTRARLIDADPSNWAAVVRKIQPEAIRKALDEFNTATGIPDYRRAYISARGSSTVTVSGPPTTLRLLFEKSKELSAAPHSYLPIFAPFHAEHLEAPDFEAIVGPNTFHNRSIRPNAYLPYLQRDSQGQSHSNITDFRSVLIEYLRQCLQAELKVGIQLPPDFNKDGNRKQLRAASVGPGNMADMIRQHAKGLELEHVHIDGSKYMHSEKPQQPVGAIAITGMGGRMPESDTLEEFWGLLERGEDVNKPIPEDRFPNADPPYYGCFMKSPGDFDNVLFNMSPREAKQINPTQRILLMITQEALEQSGYSKTQTQKKRIGTFFGEATDDWRESNAGSDIDIFYINGGMRAFSAGRLNYHYKWEGPSYGIDAACSSSLAAIELACRAIQTGDCDIAVAGGGNLLTAHPMFTGLRAGGFTSKTGSCKTLDEGADGYCRGEGVGCVVLKRLDAAVADKDNILGVIRGISTNHSAYAQSITRPHIPAQQALYRQTLQVSGLGPQDIGYVEMHGTGTIAGDTSEISSILNVFGGKETRNTPLYIGAVKSNIGHGEAAAGIASVLKSLLMLKYQKIPPHCGIKTNYSSALPNVEEKNIFVPREPTKFGNEGEPRRVMINNFNAAGGNTCMVIEEYIRPQEAPAKQEPRVPHIVTASAQGVSSLRGNLERLRDYVRNHPEVKLSDLAYTTTARRQHFDLREVFTAKDAPSLVKAIDDTLKKDEIGTKAAKAPVIFTFAGQGTHVYGIVKDLYNSCGYFRETLQECETICKDLGLPGFLDFMMRSEDAEDSDAVELQIGIVAIEYALAKTWESWGVKPDAVIGHSLGEYCAMCIAGCISLSDMLFLVGERARLMVAECKPDTHAMLAVQQCEDTLRSSLGEEAFDEVNICCRNSPSSVVLGGPVGNLEKIQGELNKRSIRTKKLQVRYAFHSSMMDPILDKLSAVNNAVPLSSPKIPFASSLLGDILHEDDSFPENYLARQCRETVNFTGALEALAADEFATSNTVWIEHAAGNPATLPLIRSAPFDIDAANLCHSLSTHASTWDTICHALTRSYLKGADIKWANIYRQLGLESKLVDLPTYAFTTKNFWIATKQEGPAQIEPADNTAAAPSRINACLHTVDEFNKGDKQVTARFSSEVKDPEMHGLISGHFVLGSALCPSSVYTSASVGAIAYTHERLQLSQPLSDAIEIGNLTLTKPLVGSAESKDKFQVTVTADPALQNANVKFSATNGKANRDHGFCEVTQGNLEAWRAEWNKVEHFLVERMDAMKAWDGPNVFQLPNPVIYKLFANVVDYAEPYRLMKNIVIDTEKMEAYADIQLKNPSEPEAQKQVHLSDAFIHFVGFVLNHGIHDSKNAFISGGWNTLRMLRSQSESTTFKAYTRLYPEGNNGLYTGDAYLLADDQVVASCYGVKFQQVHKKSLANALAQAGGAPTSSPQPAAPAESKKQRKRSSPPPKPSRAQAPGGDQMYEKARDIVARELSVESSEIQDDTNLQELGMDSILSTRMLDSLKAELGVDIPAGNFSEMTKFHQLKEILKDMAPEDGGSEASSIPSTPNTLSRTTTVASSASSASSGSEATAATSIDEEDTATTVLNCLAAQTGASMSDIEAASDFTEIGLDSILTVDVLDAVAKATGGEWPASFLSENRTAKAVRDSLGSEKKPSAPAKKESSKKQRGSKKQVKKEKKEPNTYACHSQLLTGKPGSGKEAVFLLPPGSGTLTPYFTLPGLHDETPVYALQSPFHDNPMSKDFTFDRYTTALADKVREMAKGKVCHIAGWSLGGIGAYEATRKLLESGQPVGAMVIIDAPCPKDFSSDDPSLTVEQFSKTGFLQLVAGSYGGLPEIRQQHMAASASSVLKYMPVAMSPSKRPVNTVLVWASLGEQDLLLSQYALNPGEERVGDGKEDWLNKPKTSLGPTGWDQLIGDDVQCKIVDGNHMTIMEKPGITHVSEVIGEAVTEAKKRSS